MCNSFDLRFKIIFINYIVQQNENRSWLFEIIYIKYMYSENQKFIRNNHTKWIMLSFAKKICWHKKEKVWKIVLPKYFDGKSLLTFKIKNSFYGKEAQLIKFCRKKLMFYAHDTKQKNVFIVHGKCIKIVFVKNSLY